MSMRGRGGTWVRVAASLALSAIMAMGGVPVPALAEVLEEAGQAMEQQVAEPTADLGTDDGLTPAEDEPQTEDAVIEGIVADVLAVTTEGAPASEVARSLVARLAADESLAGSEEVARAFEKAATSLGISSLVVRSGDTWWNMVEVDGAWYHVDAVWQGDDAIDLVGDETLRAIDPTRVEWSCEDGGEAPSCDADYEVAVADDAPEADVQVEAAAADGEADARESEDVTESEQAGAAEPEATAQAEEEAAELVAADVESIADQTYTGSQIKPAVVVTHGGASLVADVDYTVTYGANVNAGEGTVTVEGKAPNYSGTVSKTFNIVAASIGGAKVKLEKGSYAYTGSAIKPKVLSVTLGGKTLKQGSDYKVASYASNTNVGTATVTVSGMGNYKGSAKATFAITALNLSKASVTGVDASYPWTGSQIKPTPVVKLGGKTLRKGTDYTLSYGANKAVGKGTVTIAAKAGSNYTGSLKKTFSIVAPSLTYRAYVQTYAWRPYAKDGKTSGTTGESKRVEALQVKLGSGFPVTGGVTYRTHVQGIGWTDWAADGKTSGTTGESRRVEAIQVKLTGKMASQYNVYYRVHAQRVGWTAWAANGQSSGTTGMSWRVEAVQIKLVRKGQPAPSAAGSNTSLKVVSNPGVTYQSHVQRNGWMDWVKNGAVGGTTGQGLRVESVRMRLGSDKIPGSISYSMHVQGIGWMAATSNGADNGTVGQGRRVEAMRVILEGEAEQYFDVWYRAHVQGAGWLGWAKNGEDAGSSGASKRMEAYQVRLLPKGSAAPGPTADHAINNDWFVRKAEEEALRRMQEEPMYHYAQGYSSPTGWLILVDCTTCNVAIFSGSRGNWYLRDKYAVGVGAPSTPSRHGVWSVGGRGYSFGGSDYTCYYWVQYYNDYLFHTVPCWRGTFDVKDPSLGVQVSHGCVRQSFDKAKWLYDNIPYGTTVVVYDS